MKKAIVLILISLLILTSCEYIKDIELKFDDEYQELRKIANDKRVRKATMTALTDPIDALSQCNAIQEQKIKDYCIREIYKRIPITAGKTVSQDFPLAMDYCNLIENNETLKNSCNTNIIGIRDSMPRVKLTRQEITEEDYKSYFDNNPRISARTIDFLNKGILGTREAQYIFEEGTFIDKDNHTEIFYRHLDDLEANRKMKLNTHADYYISKIAFSVYIDRNSLVEWKLDDYNDEELNLLFHNDGENVIHAHPRELKYDPVIMFEYVRQLGETHEDKVLYAILNDIKKDTISGEPKHRDYTLTEILTTYNEDGKRTVFSPHVKLSQLVYALTKSVNIPVEIVFTKVVSGLYFPTINKRLESSSSIIKDEESMQEYWKTRNI